MQPPSVRLLPHAREAPSIGRRVRVLRRDLDQLLAEAEASATSASQPGADAGQDGEGWPDAQAFWGGP
jgi:hypothetical protein